MIRFYLCLLLSASAYGHGFSAEKDSDECEEEVSSGINRPCKLEDLDCIKHFLAANSNCQIATGKFPDVVYFPYISFVIPFLNLTFGAETIFTGMKRVRVVEFYQNTKSNNVVLAIQMRNFTKLHPRAIMTVHRRAQESVTAVQENLEVLIESVTITAVIPLLPSLRLNAAKIFGYIDSNKMEFLNAAESQSFEDPSVRKSMEALESNMQLSIIESFAAESPQFINYFIQQRLCNFGSDSKP